jgi:hypothetical protein
LNRNTAAGKLYDQAYTFQQRAVVQKLNFLCFRLPRTMRLLRKELEQRC